MARKVKGKAKAKKVKAKLQKVARRSDGLIKGSAGAKLVDAVCKPKGATHAELCEIVKWRACLPFLLKSAAQAKIKLRKEREGRVVRYFGEASA
jgi:hypothetical protein